MSRLRFLTVCIILSAIIPVAAQSQVPPRSEPVDSVEVYFRVNKSSLDPDYMGNSVRLRDFSNSYRQLTTEERAFSADKIQIYATASPEGSEQTNTRLVEQRIQSITRYLQAEFGFSPSLFERIGILYDWDLLAELIERSSETYKTEVLDVVRSDRSDVDKKAALRALDRGQVWKDLLNNYFPTMRYTHVMIGGRYAEIKARRKAFQPIARIGTELPNPRLRAPEAALAPIAFYHESSWYRDIYLKVNTAILPLLILNAAVEVDLSNHLSFHMPVYFCPFDWFSPTTKFRCLGVQPEFRYWFRPEDGWFMGAHGGVSLYNLAVSSGEYRMQDHDGTTPLIGGGLSVGYRTRLGRDPFSPWLLEFSLGAGAYDMHYDLFDNVPNGKMMFSDRQKTYFGIDNVSVSLVYKFNLKKYTTRERYR